MSIRETFLSAGAPGGPITQRKDLCRDIAEMIQEKIISDVLQPGQRLPAERELAEILGVSRVSVREAIQLLEQRGLVERRHGSGTYVREVSESIISENIERFFNFASCSHLDLIDLRELLEPEIAARVARGATASDLAELMGYVEEIEAAFASGDKQAPVEPDIRFHAALARMSRNPLMSAIMGGLHNLLRVWMCTQNEIMQIQEALKGSMGHRAILEIISARDVRGARKAMREHVKFARYSYQYAMKVLEKNKLVPTASGK